MPHTDLAKTIDGAFEARNDVSPSTKGAVREAVRCASPKSTMASGR
jgi:hypothetical protein